MKLKEWKSFDELATILEDKGITSSDRSEIITFLENVSYYRLSGYFALVGIKYGSNATVPLETLRKVYEFDEQLRHLISNALDDIETFLKNQISYYHGQYYGADGYMNPANYNASHHHEVFMIHIKKCISENRKTPVVMHHIQIYDGHFPIWVIIEFFSMGMLSYFYSDMPTHDKKMISRAVYGVHYTVMSSWLRCVTELRNKCAHFTRLYGWTFTAIPRMPDTEQYLLDRTLFTQILMLKYMYPDHARWESDFLRPLKKLIKTYKPYIRYEHIGFPYRWKAMLKYR